MLQFLLVLSVLLSGIHSPALAHEGDEPAIGFHHDDPHGAISQDQDSEQSSLAGLGADVGHHHHCPVGLASGEGAALSPETLPRDVPMPSLAAVLSSRATAPPLEPPTA